MTSCYTAFLDTARAYPRNAFLHIPPQATQAYGGLAVDYSYQEALLQISLLRAAYGQAGYGLGGRVALLLENRADFFLHFLALNSLGVCVIPVHHQLASHEMSHLIGHSDATLLVTLAEHHHKAREACARVARPIDLVTVSNLDRIRRRPAPVIDDATTGQTPAAILYTSGTTGQSKGCVLTNEYFLSWGRWYGTLGGLATLRPGADRLITPLPTNHQNAMACSTMGMVMSGGCIVQLDRFNSATWWQAVRESAATIMHYLGVMPAMLLNLPESAQDDLRAQIRFGLGAGVDPKHHAAFEQRFGFPLLEGWAMTETGGTACIMSVREPRHVGRRCIGQAPPTLDFRIVDDNDCVVAPGEPGELLVRTRGPSPRQFFFAGYHKDPGATEEAWRGGWFHTGDVVRTDADGLFYFVDRRKNVIRRSGENIAAIEVEGALLRHPSVRNCAVAAVADELRGEEVMALVQLVSGAPADEVTAREIQQHCLESLTYFKVPGHIAFVDALPIGSTQKIKRAEIKLLSQQVMSGSNRYDLRSRKRRQYTPS